MTCSRLVLARTLIPLKGLDVERDTRTKNRTYLATAVEAFDAQFANESLLEHGASKEASYASRSGTLLWKPVESW